MLSISSRRAGSSIVCPACTEEVTVPMGDAATGKPAAAPPPEAAAPKPSHGSTDDTVALAQVQRRAYDEGVSHSRKPLFDEEHADDEEHDHDDDEHDDEEGHPPKKKKFMDDTIDMTAMVDVTFLLLIFFMVTASFAAQKVFEASPPEQQESESGGGGGGAAAVVTEELESASVVVEIDAADQLKVDETPVSSLFELRETLSAKISAENKTEVLIQAEYAATHGMVVSVTDAAMDVGMQKVRRVSRKADD
jgi:biopolymer transport protein ExbD